jgi:hypothetical protein
MAYAYLISRYIFYKMLQARLSNHGAGISFSSLSLLYHTLISSHRGLDPIFALFVGVSAAAVRIRKDERNAGKTSKDTIEALQRRLRLVGRTVGFG